MLEMNGEAQLAMLILVLHRASFDLSKGHLMDLQLGNIIITLSSC